MKNAPNSVETTDYTLPNIPKKFLIPFCSFFLLYSIWINFPVTERIHGLAESLIKSIPGCAINYEQMEFGLILPRISFTDISIPQTCFQRRGRPIELKNLDLYFRGLSFSPFGPHFKLVTNVMKNDIDAYFTVGMGEFAVNIQDNIIDLKNFKALLRPISLAGKVEINTLLKHDGNFIKDAQILMKSEDLLIPGQNIMGLDIPGLNVKNLFIKGQMEGNNKFKINQMVLGDAKSPIRANLTGEIILNQRNIMESNLKLKSEVSLSEDFLQNFGLIKMFMDKFNKKDDYYQLNITGSLGAPQII